MTGVLIADHRLSVDSLSDVEHDKHGNKRTAASPFMMIRGHRRTDMTVALPRTKLKNTPCGRAGGGRSCSHGARAAARRRRWSTRS